MGKIFEKPYIYWIILIFIVYIILNIFISGFYNTIPLILKYANQVSWVKLSFSLLLSIVIGILVAINIVSFYLAYRERKKCGEAGTTIGIGTVTGLAAGVCPLCVIGLFPILFSIFGISFSFASLPFQGIEVQILAVVILLISLKMLNK